MARRPQRKRLDRTADLLSQGCAYRQVALEIAREFGVSLRTAERDIARIYKTWAAEESRERPQQKRRLRQFLWRCAARAYAEGDLGAAIRAAAQISKLDGLDAPEQVSYADMAIDEKVRRMTSDQQRRRLEELVNKWAPPERQAITNGRDGGPA